MYTEAYKKHKPVYKIAMMRLLRKYFIHRRGGLTCPPVTRCACTIYTFIHPIYGNQNQMAQAVAVIPNGTDRHSRGGLTCPPTPTGGLGNYVAQSGWICAMSALFQQAHSLWQTIIIVCSATMVRYRLGNPYD